MHRGAFTMVMLPAVSMLLMVVPHRGVPASNIVPLPPPFGNATSGCADWYIVQYLKEHGMWPPKAPIMLPMICWGPPLSPSVVQGMMSAAHECSSMGYEPLYYGNGYVVCINPKTFQTISLPIRWISLVNWFLIVSTGWCLGVDVYC